MKPRLWLEQRADGSWLACMGPSGGVGKDPQAALDELSRRIPIAKLLFTSRVGA